MIYIHNRSGDSRLEEIVSLSFIRAYTKSQVSLLKNIPVLNCVVVVINPVAEDYYLLNKISFTFSKIILLGELPPAIAKLIGLKIDKLPRGASLWDECGSAPVNSFSQSRVLIEYLENLPFGLESPIKSRPLLRFDYSKEWNNLGYGHVTTDGTKWSVSCVAKPVSTESVSVASLYLDKDYLTSYIVLSGLNTSQVLWVNRSVGLVDTSEFRLIETFITNYLPEKSICLPLLREIPFGYDAMISMRLDCDEAIASSRELFELYKAHNIPFSLAIKSGQPIDKSDTELIEDVVKSGGAVLSHSVNHKPNWGDSYQEVLNEAFGSRQEIIGLSKLIDSVDYAVSPFHKNSEYAVRALDELDYKGFIGGIICNDPEFLISRAGVVMADLDIVSHSQQCMLHGDVLLSVIKQSVSNAVKGNIMFAYLDHPFSERYQYGWESEASRLEAHASLINYIKKINNVLFVNENELLDFVVMRSRLRLSIDDGKVIINNIEAGISEYIPSIEYKSKIIAVSEKL